MSSEITICTIISKNYISFARVLTESFLKNNPKGKVFVLLVDDLDGEFDPDKEKFTLVKINEIGIINLDSFCFKYSILEQNTGTKANFLKYLFEKYKLKKLAYFDPDIFFTNNLENLWNLLDKKSIAITPHLIEPISDDKHPSELDILISGTYNMGFIALSNSETTKQFLEWWISHLMEHGFNDIKKGLFTDQKWIDLVPSIFDDVYIIRHPGYNVAYWNLSNRKIVISEKNNIKVNDKPMYFFHFSGFSPENMENVSKHQNRFTLKKIESVRPFFEMYRDLLIENGYLDTKDLKCKFEYFDNGIKIPNFARKVFNDAIQEGKNFKNPFSTTQSNSFFHFLNENIDENHPTITRLWYKIYQERDDLKEIFPDCLGKNREDFLNWIKNSLITEYGYDEIFSASQVLKSSKPTYSNPIIKNNISTKKKKTSEIMGMNVAGYLKGEFGVAESARNFVAALKSVDIPFALNNIISNAHKNNDTSLSGFKDKNPYPINLIIVNADQTNFFYNEAGPEYFKNKYNIGVWAWELPSFPKKFAGAGKFYDEIWVLSNFVSESISNSLPIPVINIPSPIQIDQTKLIKNRKKFGLSEKDFVFLFMFDFYSVFQRKNPLATLQAFKKAFRDENVTLVIKSINGSKFPSELKKLKEACDTKNIILIEDHLTKDDIFSLLASSDCYVSLHRSEGFGLTMAEAMFAKKPVIATAYGGNTDFININNSFPVKYKLIELEKDFGPYKKGNFWAEPDIEHASSLMRQVYENKKDTEKIVENAFNFISENLSPKTIGAKIQNRINILTENN